jgi:2TM domain-containing protein
MAVERDEQYEEAKRRVEARKGFYVHAFFFVVLNAIFLAAVGWDFLWATVFWGLGLVLHGASVFFSASDWVKRWEQRAIQREVERQRGGARKTGSASGGAAPPPPPAPGVDDTKPTPTAQRTSTAKKRI